ncbi:MAG: hypothetical protein SF162_01470 [bacterium]|nr:hypothetical protein [bacterium]
MTEIIAVLDRIQPPKVLVRWMLNDGALVVPAGAQNAEIKVRFPRNDVTDVGHLLKARGYRLVKEDIDPRGGMEGQLIFER